MCAPLYKQVVASHPYNSSNILVYPDFLCTPPTYSVAAHSSPRPLLISRHSRPSTTTYRWLAVVRVTHKEPILIHSVARFNGADRKLFWVRSDWTNITVTPIQIMSLVVIQSSFFCFSQGYETSKPTLPTISPTLFYEWSLLLIGHEGSCCPAPSEQSVRVYLSTWTPVTSIHRRCLSHQWVILFLWGGGVHSTFATL